MKRPRPAAASTSAVVLRADLPDFDPREHGWNGADGGLGHSSDDGTLAAAAWTYARAAVGSGAGVAEVAAAALSLYRLKALGLTARDVVSGRHPEF